MQKKIALTALIILTPSKSLRGVGLCMAKAAVDLTSSILPILFFYHFFVLLAIQQFIFIP